MIRVFVAEDEPLILHDISDLISKLNKTFSVTRSCTNGRQVLQALNKEIPDKISFHNKTKISKKDFLCFRTGNRTVKAL